MHQNSGKVRKKTEKIEIIATQSNKKGLEITLFHPLKSLIRLISLKMEASLLWSFDCIRLIEITLRTGYQNREFNDNQVKNSFFPKMALV